MNEKGKTGKGNWGKMLLAVASWEWLPVFGLAMSGRVRLLSTHGWSIILMWAVRECAAWEDTKLILKNTGEKNCTGLPSLSLKQTVGTDTVWETEDETWSDSQVEEEVLHWKRGTKYLFKMELKKKSLYQWSFNLNSCLRADYNIQWLGEALVKVDQHLQPWKFVNLQKRAPHTNTENVPLCHCMLQKWWEKQVTVFGKHPWGSI